MVVTMTNALFIKVQVPLFSSNTCIGYAVRSKSDETCLEVGHSPIAKVYWVVRICLDGPRVPSNRPIKVSTLERFVSLGFKALSSRGIPCAFAATYTCRITLSNHVNNLGVGSTTQRHTVIGAEGCKQQVQTYRLQL